MNEQEWLGCTEPVAMLAFLRGRVSDRKLRLFACACCRRIWRRLSDKRSREAVEAAEHYADGGISDEECSLYREAAFDACDKWTSASAHASRCAAYNAACPPQHFIGSAGDAAANSQEASRSGAESGIQANFVRDIFGNPFRPITINPAWLNPTVLSLAQAAYDNRNLPSGTLDNARLGVLADALEDAGASDAILEHLRSEGPHVRGCFALDSILGK